MKTLNRSAFIVRPKEPYLRWAGSVDEGARRAAQGLRGKVSIYLVPEDPKGEAETPPLKDYFGRIFDHELEAWCRDEARWPEERDLKTFQEWFEVAGESIITDLACTSLRREEL